MVGRTRQQRARSMKWLRAFPFMRQWVDGQLLQEVLISNNLAQAMACSLPCLSCKWTVLFWYIAGTSGNELAETRQIGGQ